MNIYVKYILVAVGQGFNVLEANMKRPLPGKVGTPSPMGEVNEGNWGVGTAHSALRAGEPSTWGRGWPSYPTP